MAIARKNGTSFGNDGFNIFSPLVNRWRYRYLGKIEMNFTRSDNKNAANGPSKWSKISNVEGYDKLIFQDSSISTIDKAQPATTFR